MRRYFKNSIEKFKQDALPKLLYDILKWVIPTLCFFAISKIIPSNTSIGTIISKKVSLTTYSLLLAALIIIAITVILVSIFFNRRYRILEKDNFTDRLTGLENHKAFENYLTQKITEIKNSDKTLSLIIIDVDNFRKFNDDFSPSIADSIIAKIGEILGNEKRITDRTFRENMRGDEFAVVTTETSLNDAFTAAERRRQIIEKTVFEIGEDTYNVTVSCGVTELNKQTDDFVNLKDRAHKALKQAKGKRGKNNTAVRI